MAAATVEEYIAGFPPEVRVVLARVRETIRQNVPGSVEIMSYDMPTITLNGKKVVHWGAWKKHLALYGIHKLDGGLEREVEEYRAEESTLQFPYRKGVPVELIGQVVGYLATHPAS